MGAEMMKAQLKDKNALAQVEMNLSESQKRLNFLEEQMAKLVAKKNGVDHVSTLPQSSTSGLPPMEGGRRASQASIAEGAPAKKGFFKSLFASKQSVGGTTNTSTTSVAAASTVGGSTMLSRSDSTATMGKKHSFSSLEMSRTSATLTAEKIAVRLQELRAKHDQEQQCKVGFDKMYQSYQNRDLSSQEKKTKEETELKIKDQSSRIALLKIAINRYQGMHVEGLADLTGVLILSYLLMHRNRSGYCQEKHDSHSQNQSYTSSQSHG